MDPKDFLTIIVWGSVVAFVCFLGLRHFNVSNSSKSVFSERRRELDSVAREDSEEDVEDLKHIALASELLPNAYAAMARLNERFIWREILFVTGYHELHIQLLHEISANETIELPSLHASRPDRVDKLSVAAAVKAARASGEGEEFRFGDIISGPPIEVFQQEPTVSTLMELATYELVTVTPPPSHDIRVYWATLTTKGDRLVSFDMHFNESEKRSVVRLPRPRSETARRAVAVLLNRALIESPPPTPNTAFTELQQGTLIYHLLHDEKAGSTRLINLRLLLVMPTEPDADELWEQDFPVEKRITRLEAIAAIAEARSLISNPKRGFLSKSPQ